MCSSIEHSPIMILASGHPDPLDSRDNQSIPDPASSLHSTPQGTYGEDLNTYLILVSRLFCPLYPTLNSDMHRR